MKNKLKSILCLTVLLFTFAFPSCTKDTAENSESGSTPPPETERNMLTNVFTEEPLELPDGFSISSSAAIEHNGEETRVHLTKYIPDGDISRNEHYIYRIPEEGEPVLEKLELDSDVLDGTSLFCGDDLIVFESSFDDSTFISSYNLVKCSLTDGKTTRVDNVTDIFPTPVEQLTSFVADADGYIYMTDGNSLCVMAPDLTKAFDYVFRDSVSSLAVSADGKVFAVGTDAVYTIDRDLCAPGNPLEMPEGLSIENCYFGPGYDIYYENNEGLYGYNFGSESGECVISWQNSNMEGSMFDNIHVLSPEKVFATRFDFKNNEIAAVILEKTDDIDLSDYVTIEVAYAYEPPYYSQTVLDYNSDRTKKIRVITKDYSVYNTETKKDGAKKQLLLDMTTGKYMPDIVVDMPDYIKVTDKTAIITLLKQGYYRDLYEFIDKDPDISRDDIVGAVKNSYEIDGKLAAAVPFFQIETLAAPSSALGGRTSWTMEEMLDFADTLDVPKLINNKDFIFNSWNAAYSFIDVANGTCDFENETFLRYLKFLADEEISLPKSTNRYEHYQTGKVMLYEKIYHGPRSLTAGQILFYPDDYTLIGYPAAANGLRRHTLTMDFAYMITTGSAHPEEAWDFIKSAIFQEHQHFRGSHFHMLKSLNDQNFEYLRDFHVFYKADGFDREWMGKDPSDLAEDKSTIGGQPGLYTSYNERDVERINQLVEEAGYPVVDMIPAEVGSIINEEISVCLEGIRSAEDTAKVIQSRVSIWLSERQ